MSTLSLSLFPRKEINKLDALLFFLNLRWLIVLSSQVHFIRKMWKLEKYGRSLTANLDDWSSNSHKEALMHPTCSFKVHFICS